MVSRCDRMLYDFYFVRPENIKEKREAINRKLADTGQRQMISERRTA